MIHLLSEKIAFLFSEKKLITEDMREIYAFGFEIMIATVINIVLLIALSFIFGIFLKTIFMIVPFMIIRCKAGGYHAKTHFSCVLFFISTYIFSIYFLSILSQNMYLIYTISAVLILSISVLKYGIVPSKNREVTQEETERFTADAKIRILMLSMANIIVFMISPDYGIFISHGLLIAAGSIIFELIKRRIYNEKI